MNNLKGFKVKEHKRTNIIAELKNGKLLITAIKVMADNSDFKSYATLDSKAIADLKRAKSYHDFRALLAKKYLVPNALLIDSRAKKAGLTKNTNYDGTADVVASIIKPAFRVLESRKKLQQMKKSKKAVSKK